MKYIYLLSIFLFYSCDSEVESPKNTPPTAIFKIMDGSDDQTKLFDASGSSDKEDDNSSLSVRWDYENDKTWDTGFSTLKKAVHQYSTSGTYEIAMEVKDSEGLTDTLILSTTLNINTAPTARFSITNDDNFGDLKHFDASLSSDSEDDDALLQVRWDFESDNTWDTEFSTDKQISHQYFMNGEVRITLEVKDSKGLTNTFFATRAVSNDRPTAKIAIENSKQDLNQSFQFDGSQSTDTETPLSELEFRWDFNDDGIWDTDYSTQPTISHKYDVAGVHIFALEVKDKSNQTNIAKSYVSAINIVYENSNVSLYSGSTQGYQDGDVSVAKFDYPGGLVEDSQGNIFVVDINNHKIRKITPSGTVSTFAGSTLGFADGNGTNAKFNYPIDIAIDANDTLYVTDYDNHKIRKISPSGDVTTYAGSDIGNQGGDRLTAKFNNPYIIVINSLGDIFFSDVGNNTIKRISANGNVTDYAGSTTRGYADGNGTSAMFNTPMGLTIDSQNNIYVADNDNNKIRKIAPNQDVTTVTGSDRGYNDGSVSEAMFFSPIALCVDSDDNIYVLDFDNNSIRKISTSGNVSTLAGNGISGDETGAGNESLFNSPFGIMIHSNGEMIVSDYENHKLKKITF